MNKKLYQVNYISFDECDSYLWTEFGKPTSDKKAATADFKQTCENTRDTLKDDKKEGSVEWFTEDKKDDNRRDFVVMENGSTRYIRIELVEFEIKED